MKIAIHIYQLLNTVERRRAVGVLLLTIVAVLLETFSIGLIIPALTLMTQSGSSAKYSTMLNHLPDVVQQMDPKALVAWAMGFMVLLYVVKAIYLLFLSWVQASFTFSAQLRVSQQLMKTYLSQPYSFHLQRNSAQLIHNATTGINLFAGAILHTLIVATESLVVGAVFAMLLIVEPLGTLAVALLLGVAGGLLHSRTRQRLSAWGRHYHKHEGMRIQHIQQGLGGIKEVLLLGRAKVFVDRYDAHSRSAARMAKYQGILQNLPRLALEAFAVAALACLVVTMIGQGRSLSAVVTTLGLFATAAFRLIPSANRILSSLQSLAYHDAAVTTLAAELADAPVSAKAVEATRQKISAHWKMIQFSGVDYSYDGAQENALTGISLTIPRGQVIGIVGASGSGKSTAIDILLGLLKPTTGQVTLDGQDISNDMRGWQRQIGYVPQAIFLTDEPLRQNIAFGIPPDEIDEVAVERALKAAQLYDFVNHLPRGVETEVGERGARLSGGQRQRIGIARALYHDPEVLVLDEATSALDGETEEDVMQAIQSLRGEKTIILVAHRMSTVAQCDHLYRLSGGRVVAQGRPRDMLSSNKI
ncbi:ABC transporter ATP-binding protein [Rhizobium grahamii]|uniref:ABC transporter ATP-binding protein n=1 Tax=Rhizobium grahamii TaxID=1120045 RepID=A0A5Q0C7U7_9HYPH|nr:MULTISPECIES: ABC transporter ATP-binding protein [Rhizobium]QFY62028.1 ABC transporter ATP-binding protein [Rhizobium grahamii]QRM48795.1 ABC transporter ATP-binding protein [Rhizobium sp. BG6]